MARSTRYSPSWDGRQNRNPARSCEDRLHTASPKTLIQGVRGLAFVLYEVADSPNVICDDEADIRYVAERIELYMSSLLEKLTNRKSTNRQEHSAKNRREKKLDSYDKL